MARVERTLRFSIGSDGTNRILLALTVVMLGLVQVLDLRKPSAAIVLGPTSSLLVTKILTGSRCEKSCRRDRAVSMRRKLNRFYATDQHALHSQHCDASSSNYLDLEIALRSQPWDHCQ